MSAAPKAPASPQTNYQLLRSAFAELEIPIYDLMRLLRAAEHLQEEGDEDLRNSACLIVELAFKMADELNEQYQKNFPGEGVNSRIIEEAA
jgi:hypothetical protein